jgi:hypothetical protein
MKKTVILLVVALSAMISCAQTQNKGDVTARNAVVFQLFPTQNMWTFIKLDTRNGKMWQVQYDVKDNNRFETYLNTQPLVAQEKETSNRFTLYSTQNIYTFILLDQIDGRMWQVQWAMNRESRFIVPIE